MTVITDHNNLELFQTTKVLNRRQDRGAQELAGCDFKIFFRPGRQNIKADYLGRRLEYRREKGEDREPENILKESSISRESLPVISEAGEGLQFVVSPARVCSIPPIRWNEEFLQQVQDAASQDEQYQAGLRSLSATPGSSDYIKPSEHLTVEKNTLSIRPAYTFQSR